VISTLSIFFTLPVYSQTWPTSWIQIDWDKNENGSIDDWRDVEYAYYQFDSSYLYLKFECYDIPGKEWLSKDGRYKWFIDLDGNLYHSGENIFEAEYLLFVEDYDDDGAGEIYLLYEANDDGDFGEYEPDSYAPYEVTNTAVAGWRIVSQHQIEMYVSWASLGNPPSYGIDWATDQENPNLDQGPTTDHRDEEEPIVVHDVAALSQTPSPTTVTQGSHVTIEVVAENQGTQTESFDVTCYFDTSIVGTLPVTNLHAGYSTTLSFDWDTAAVPPGLYTIEAWADSGAVITESDETDNWCTALATVTVQPQPVHDVAATSQVPDQTNVQQGSIVNIDVTIENLGDFTETFDVNCYYDSIQIGTPQTVTSLAPGSSTHVPFAWDTTGVIPDVYYVKAVADSGHVISEADENNNNCTSLATVTVYVPGQPGDLFVDKAKTAIISGPDPPVVGFTTVYELTITVTNPGGSNVVNVVVNDTISSDVSFVSVGTPSQGSVIATPPPKIVWNVGILTPGASATLNFQVSATPTGSGLLYLNRKEDLSATGLTDTQTVSDLGDTDVTVTAIVRDVAATSQIPSITTIIQGETIAIDIQVQNLGDQTESFDVTCYYDSTPIGTLRVYNLPPSGSETLKFDWDTTGITPGIYDIKAEADSSDEIDESNETNNECTNPASVEIVIHDIAVISQIPSPTIVIEGETVTVQVVVQNQGTEPETFTVTLYYDSSQVGTAQVVTNLLPSNSKTVTFSWDTTGVTPGAYYMSAVASTVPGETDTNDNSCTSTTIVTITAPTPPPLPPTPVGGVWVPISKTELLAPWITLVSLITLASVSVVYVRRRKKQKN